jgi:hypothetical protein
MTMSTTRVEFKRARVWSGGRETLADVATIGETSFVVDGRVVRVARAEHEWDTDVDEPETILRVLRDSTLRIDLFTFQQRLPHTEPRFAYRIEWDNVAAIPITTFDAWWSSHVVKETRNKVRKSIKAGVEIQVVDFDESFVDAVLPIYNEAPLRQGKPFVDYGKDRETIKRKLSTFPDRSGFIGAYYRGTMIGFLKLVFAGRFTRTMHILSMIRHRDKAPTNALIAKAVELCAERSIPYLVYGQFDYGKKGGGGLAEFKHYTGFQKVMLPRYYIPMSPFGHLCLRFGLHQGIAELLPQMVTKRLLDLRGRWYRAKYAASTSGMPDNA